MRILAPLLLVALCLGIGLSDQSGQQPTPFRKDNVYVFQYNSQISSGLSAPNDEDSADPQQNSAIRIRAQAKITFASDRHGQLQLEQIRIGQLNEQLSEPEKVQPMAIFEPKQIPEEKQHQLELPVQFHYDEGVVERVQFQNEDDVWSKNVKRAVLNMIQLNLKRNNAQGLRTGEEQQEGEEEESQSSEGGQLPELGRTFNIPEITLEGVCQTTYAINKAGQRQQGEQQETTTFNVTKTINFKQCTKIADLGYGFQTEQPQPQCSQCQLYWSQNEQQNQNGRQQQHTQQHPCAKCDPKKVKEQMLDRSTVLRYQLVCPSGECESSQKFGLKRTELLSQYVFKQAKSQTGKFNSAMQTIVAATLKFQSMEQKSESVPSMSGGKDESLMFSSEMDLDVKRFYMYGDEEFSQPESSPFHKVPKVQHAQQALRKLTQTMTGDKQTGIEVQAGFEVQRLVELLRMSRREELEEIEQNAIGNGPNGGEKDRQKAKQIYTDSLAICGTRNCIQKLAEKIQNKEISQMKAAQALRTLTQVPAPSEQILKIVQRLCKQENVHNERSVKQSCWLTFGALVNELCQHKTPKKGTQKYAFEAKSALDKKDQCPQEKKEEYKQTIMDLYTSAATIYDKVLALSALGNAGIENAVGDIEQIIKDRSEACLVRCKAVDALRRLRTQMPRKIQQILLPIFQNAEEHSLLRAAALAILLPTQPDSSMIDQIAFTIAKEGNRQIQAYAYQEMKNLAKSKNPVDQQIAKHMKNALRMTNVDEEQLRNSGKWQFPVYSEQVQEGVFIEFAQMVSSRSAAPAYLHAQIDSFVNDQFQAGQMKLYIAQQEAENWYQQTTSSQNAKTPTQRRSFSFGQSLRNIFSALGIKSRRNDEENNRQPFAMFALRTRDVDQAFVAIDGSSKEQQDVQLQEMLGQFLSGQSKPSLERFLSQFHQNQQQSQQQQKEEHRGVLVTNLNEQQAKIPTSAGLPLRILTTNPVLATIEGQTQLSSESARLDSPLGVQTQINVHSMASLVHIQKMEYSLPFMVAGVESVRSLELNVPMQAELNANPAQGQFSVKVKLPRQKHTLFGFHSLPFTYTAQVDTTSKLVHEPRQFRAIHHPRLERMQHEVSKNYKFAQQLGIPLHIQGHYHWPTQSGTGPQQFLQMLMATENVIHIVYQPNEETPREAIFRINGNQFQRTDGQKPQLEDFYREQIESAFESQELNNFEMEPSHLRGQKLRNFIGNYEASNQYKHSVKLVAQTVGGPNEAKAQAEVAASCDAKMQACNAQLDAQFGKLAGEKWTMKIQSSVAMPESVESIDELAQLEQRNNKFQGKIQAEWGIGGHQKEHVNIRIQGEQARKRQNIQNNELVRNEQGKRRLLWRQAFLNKFDLEAQYQLKAQTVNHFGKMLECLKTSYYWNSQTQPNYEQMQGQNGGAKTLVSLVIDPVTQKHANISIKTPNQQIRLQQIELPIRGRPFPLVRQQQQSIHSLGQIVNRIQVQGRAECTVDGRNVNTFDNVQFNAPLSDACYTVLAKDCSSGEPKFVVLMKAQDNIDSGSRNSPKKLKVITPEKQIECEPKTTFSEGEQRQIVCKENGNEVQNNNDSESVEFNNAKKSDVNVHVSGISVRFNGRKAWLKVSSLYKNSQCGLCGHYDDSVQDEWRMSNNENTNDLAEFHRSYTLNDNQQGEQCNQQELNNFYRLNGNKIRQGQNRRNSDEVDDGNDDWMDEQFDGQLNGQSDWNENWEQQSRNGNNNKRRIETPVKKTKMVELSNKICVSQKTIKQCPRGYIAIYGDGNESQEDAFDQNNNADEGKSFKFSCFNRNTAQARDILRQVRNGNNVLQFEEREHSIVEKIREPKKCVRGNY